MRQPISHPISSHLLKSDYSLIISRLPISDLSSGKGIKEILISYQKGLDHFIIYSRPVDEEILSRFSDNKMLIISSSKPDRSTNSTGHEK